MEIATNLAHTAFSLAMGQESELCPGHVSIKSCSYKEPTGLWKWYQTEKQLQWNLDITCLYTNEVLTLTSDIFCPSSSKININNLYVTKPRYSEQILPVSHGPFSLYRAVPLYFNDTSQCKPPLPQKKTQNKMAKKSFIPALVQRKKQIYFLYFDPPNRARKCCLQLWLTEHY